MSFSLSILYTGGTLGMRAGANGLLPASGMTERLKALLDTEPKIRQQLGHIEWSLIESTPLLDSANMAPPDWERIAKNCLRQSQSDGIVIIHGTDTLAYTASALAFFLSGIGIPVIITGSQKPLEEDGSDAPANLVGAMLAAGQTGPGVWVYFDQQIMPGARVVKKDALHFDGFAAPRLAAPYPTNAPDICIGYQSETRDWASIQVVSSCMQPGYRGATLLALIDQHPDAIILSLYGLGTLADRNTELLEALKIAQQQGIIVVAVSQCYIGAIDFSVYATGAELAGLGVLSAKDLTLEAAYTKLIVLLRMGYSCSKIKQLLLKNLANDMSEPE